MDYNLAALKLFCGQLKHARQAPSSSSAMTIGSILFQRAWLQGVLVSGSEEGQFILDDGSSVVELSLSNEFRLHEWKSGMYVLVVGVLDIRVDDPPLIKVHKIVDLSSCPDREAMWHLEVIEAYRFETWNRMEGALNYHGDDKHCRKHSSKEKTWKSGH